ncbi:hypothetical protein [Magnetofaba australis]|uniref:EF-hand domain-containing protein n=1 Tax=Magnetofaba australis IT-1 TaxID=1434232 RepID=A0A1Y2JZ08_9PROT|nr:hypothetical protein [Magnetofaba australis]OSM00130.1 hypothetical protein MAIT1_00563 [Magnetofaba australis IT-1]
MAIAAVDTGALYSALSAHLTAQAGMSGVNLEPRAQSVARNLISRFSAQLTSQLDTDESGALEGEELSAFSSAVITRLDVNGDKALNSDEFANLLNGAREGSMALLDFDADLSGTIETLSGATGSMRYAMQSYQQSQLLGAARGQSPSFAALYAMLGAPTEFQRIDLFA